MREILSVADRIEDLSREIPVSSYSGFLEETNFKIKKLAAQDAFFIDVFRSMNAFGECKKIIKQLEESSVNSGFVLNVRDENNCNIKIFEEVLPSVALVFLDEEMQQSGILRQHFRKSDEQYKLVLLVNLLEDERNLRDFSRLFGYRSKVITLTAADFTDKSIVEVLKSQVEVPVLDKLKKMSYLNSIKPVFSFLGEILSAESKSANTRKLLNNQNTQITRKEEQSLNTSELTSGLRQLIQKSASEFEKNYKLKYEDLNKPITGKFSTVAIEETNRLKDFNKKSLAEKSEKVETSIDPAFTEQFLKTIGTTIRTELGKDEAFIKSSFEDLLSQVNAQLRSKGIQPLKSDEIFPPFPDKDRTLQSFCYINRAYVGEIIKKGAMEYFVALRDYTGLIMVVGGLLAPLTIVASASDSGIFKEIANWVRGTTAAISLSMILYGVVDLRKRIPKKREEEFQRELGKAKETLQQESKRIFNESSRDWTGNIANWIKDTTQNINAQIERNIKNLMSQKAAQMNQEKLQQQKQQQTIDIWLRGIQSAERVRDQITTRYRDIVAETERELKF
ncbi:hypothetical protein [Pontibacter sp. SGAir0037]|uniref:hypothetical protein n=1 Tax=Pontibacter sp. SGAir0037 TaxID=2571030 RepID=UPI0010CD6263|nr:hypothetical protein [Pontibacter sp. SGAir0037]QCR21557.1 hypothetical protein C1N53_03810 [Pontibacter sp. SGAir0037]